MRKIGLISTILTQWREEFKLSIAESPSIYIALFKESGELIFANKTIKKTFRSSLSPAANFLNPPFSRIVSNRTDESLVYNGYVTLGSFDTENISLLGRFYKKGDEILFIGGVETQQLLEQNKLLYNLNSEINKLQRQLVKEKSLLEEANAAKDKFFSILAHDLKNPFNALLGFSEFLIENFRDMEQEEIEEQLTMMRDSSRQTFALLEDLLTWSKAQRGKLECKPQTVKIKDICEEVRGAVKGMAEEKEIEIELSAAENAEIFADPNIINTIMRNLLSNAIKFSYRGGKIVTSLEDIGNNFKISVKDSGTGISAENQVRLWNLAGQHTTRGTEDESGTGLGLLICKEFAEAHKGKIWVESEEGKGSTFIFTIPKL